MKVFGITGGIGSGKSTVANFMRRKGVPVVDADMLSREAVSCFPAIIQTFGPQVIGKDGQLDRKALGQIVFSDPVAKTKLEAILHPRIQEMARERFDKLAADGYPLAAYDVPLLFEAGLQDSYRPVVLVYVDEAEQIKRVMARSGLSEQDARARIAAQMPLAEKAQKADILIDNRGSREDLQRRVIEVLAQIRLTYQWASGAGVYRHRMDATHHCCSCNKDGNPTSEHTCQHCGSEDVFDMRLPEWPCQHCRKPRALYSSVCVECSKEIFGKALSNLLCGDDEVTDPREDYGDSAHRLRNRAFL